ncbi:MAG: AAA family ATPase [Candidatus Vogelbacteria bacterium]|nr:AAA family ATPase [Candidatus Vogelbacteria bacterium]
MIFIVGHHGVGKSTFGNWLKSKGFIHLETSKLIKDVFTKSGSNLGFIDWVLEQGDDNINQIIVDNINAEYSKAGSGFIDIVITGNRQFSGIEYIKNHVEKSVSSGNTIIYLNSPVEVLYERYHGRNDGRKSYESVNRFQEELITFDKTMGVEEIQSKADYIINTDKELDVTLEDLAVVIKKVYGSVL